MQSPTKYQPKGRCLLLVLRLCSVHLWSVPRYSSFLRNLPTNTKVFCAVYGYVKKVNLSKGYQNPKRKLGVTTYFSEIIELKFGRKLPYILCFLKLFQNYGCLIISEKCKVNQIFSCYIFPIRLAKICFSPIFITFGKTPLYQDLCISQFQLRPCPPSLLTPGHQHFFLLDGKFPGVGTLQLPNAPLQGRRKRANAPPPGSYVPNQHCSSFHSLHNNATFSIFMCDFSLLWACLSVFYCLLWHYPMLIKLV